MPTLDEHQSGEFTKVVYIGGSGTGKTGSLVSLLAEGYNLVILDTDNGLDVLRQYARKHCPDKLKNVRFETVRDEFKAHSVMGPVVKGTPKAFVRATELMTKWSDDSVPAEFGPQTIFVLDSLTGLSKAAFEWARSMNPSAKEPRTWYGVAQGAIENIIAMLTGKEFQCNVIVISHVDVREMPDGTFKGSIMSIGKALNDTLPKYFNTLVLAESAGSGDNVKRKIKVRPTGMIDLKTPVPDDLIPKDFPLETGLADLFKILRNK